MWGCRAIFAETTDTTARRPMPAITIYTTQTCPYCMSAKRLLSRKGMEFNEIDVSADPARRAEMMQRAGGRYTVPQIFIGTQHVGGCDDLYDLEAEGKLDGLLAG
jgi:glutaredoxin 3